MNRSAKLRRFVGYLIIVNIIVLVAALFWPLSKPGGGVSLAVAKSSRPLGLDVAALPAFNPYRVQAIALANSQLAAMLADKSYEFVNAIPLSYGEARYWQDAGCGRDNCAVVTLYNYTDGGTIEGVVNTESAQLITYWTNPLARPAGTPMVATKAVEIAATDPQVQAILGDIRTVEQAMVPMSGWLMDDACRDEWCVDLTFQDPTGSGRIFHVFVNMEQSEVARTFYTRARPELRQAKPAPQRFAYSDGCHEQYGWSICWEMTGHDGVHFYDATYEGTLIFSSAKVPQVEAWYPSWPGGYRDEIGFSASVPPFGGTEINDFGDSFEVRQLFTEFTRWPNCICCYRYEEIMRFYDDGTFEPRFVSHGPGCDDLSIYRPLWRIDIDLDGPENDSVWLWQTNQWVEATAEFETFPFVDDVSPDGNKIATVDKEIIYQWRMLPTDPLGLDEARFFVQAKRDEEGTGPVATGPGDTFQPPRQWLNDEPLDDEDVVLWYVALLKTKKGGPWWCMPDPEPEVNHCEAILRAEPAADLHQPTAEELAQLQAATATAEAPAAPASPMPTATLRPIEGDDAEEVILNAGCGSCHKIGSLGEQHKVGPDLSSIGLAAAERRPGLSAEAYLRESILLPNAFIAPDCPNGPCQPNIMPQDYGSRLSPQQVEMIVTFLLEQTATEEQNRAAPVRIGDNRDGTQSTPAPKAFPSPKRLPQINAPSTISVQILLVSLVFLLTLFRLLKGTPEEEE